MNRVCTGHEFAIEPAWQGKRIYIVFEGSMTDTEVKINGRSAGGLCIREAITDSNMILALSSGREKTCLR